jgi:site-specific DNA-methyltransferase (adenine-specific)
VGYEINKEFLPVIKAKIGCPDIEVINQKKFSGDFKEEIGRLPYVFKDPVKFDKKTDPKKLKFGSRIDHTDQERETYHTVKEVLSPEMLVLDNGLKVRLLGVKEDRAVNGKALKYLSEKFKGEKVFLKYDSMKHDKEGNLFCYVYLKNKTFINAHLIKNHLSDVDTSLDYRYRAKFIALKKEAS